MPDTFQRIGLIGKYQDPGIHDTLRTLVDHLQASGRELVIDEATARTLPDCQVPAVAPEDIARRCQLAIVVGGDGTFLNAARTLRGGEVALMGINLGRLGFMVDVSPAEMLPRLDEILAGRYIEEQRFLLDAEVVRDGQCILRSAALNDVVLHKWQVARMIEFETTINGLFVHRHRSDGIIVSTPTGSTAYALSGGGPILHPSLDALQLVPICPHTLTNRPLVVTSDCCIEIVITHSGDGEGQITCDGQLNERIRVGDQVRIQARERRLRLIHPADYDYFAILRNKLRWSEHP